jgi:DnaD/phage-associated family protein
MRISNKILEIIPEANPLHSVIFIYAKAHEEKIICPKEYSKVFNTEEEEVIRAFQYFQLKRFIHLKIDEQLHIEFIEKNTREKLVLLKPELNMRGEEEDTEAEFTPEEIAYFLSFDEVKAIFDAAEKILGTLLNFLQQCAVLSFYENYRFTKEVIEEILHYAVKNSRTHSNQLYEIAKNWDNIKENNSSKDGIKEILKALSISKRDITPKITSKIEEWQESHSVEMILEACDRTIMKFCKPNPIYTEAILNDWYKNGIKTIEQMQKYNEAHSENFEKFKEKVRPSKKSKFNNYKSSNRYKRDYATMIKELQETY